MSKEKNSPKKKKLTRTTIFFDKIRSKVTKKGTTSAARLTRLPQIHSDGLSYAGKHLLLLIQHSVDENKVKVPIEELSSWETLTISNPDLIIQKNHIKELCNVHHFSSKELEEIASRVTLFVGYHQPHNVNM